MKLNLEGVPVDQIDGLWEAMSLLIPKGSVLVTSIAHDDGCPCIDGTASMTKCTCQEVNVTLDTERPLGRFQKES